jgi:hypothetical protein
MKPLRSLIVVGLMAAIASPALAQCASQDSMACCETSAMRPMPCCAASSAATTTPASFELVSQQLPALDVFVAQSRESIKSSISFAHQRPHRPLPSELQSVLRI